jgi:hypothetical protein
MPNAYVRVQILPVLGAVLLRELNLTPQAIPLKLSGVDMRAQENALGCTLLPHSSSLPIH